MDQTGIEADELMVKPEHSVVGIVAKVRPMSMRASMDRK